MSLINHYIGYLEDLCTRHVSIGHSAQEKHFFRMHELLTDLTGRVNFPAVIIENYQFSLRDQQTNNILKAHRITFSVLKHLQNDQDWDQVEQIWQDCEEIGMDLLIRAYNERYSLEEPVVDIDLNDVETELIEGSIERTYGVRFTVTLVSRQPHIMNASKWNDLG